MMHLVPLIVQPQRAGYETLVIILLILFWGIYRYYQSSKNTGIPDETEEDFSPEPSYDIPEAKAVFRDPFLTEETTIYNSRGSDPISANVMDTSLLNQANDLEANDTLAEFDPKKAVIWAEIIKRPYC